MSLPMTESDLAGIAALVAKWPAADMLEKMYLDAYDIYRAGLAAGAAREREECANITDRFASMESGAGELEPGARLRQCSAAIRSRAPAEG